MNDFERGSEQVLKLSKNTAAREPMDILRFGKCGFPLFLSYVLEQSYIE